MKNKVIGWVFLGGSVGILIFITILSVLEGISIPLIFRTAFVIPFCIYIGLKYLKKAREELAS